MTRSSRPSTYKVKTSEAPEGPELTEVRHTRIFREPAPKETAPRNQTARASSSRAEEVLLMLASLAFFILMFATCIAVSENDVQSFQLLPPKRRMPRDRGRTKRAGRTKWARAKRFTGT